VFHSFDGKQVLKIDALKRIKPRDFDFVFKAEFENKQTRKDYTDSFNKLKKEIDSNQFNKVILSRTKKINTEKSPLVIFDHLNEKYSETLNYVITNPKIGTWIGATPEKLFETSGLKINTMSLAGTKLPEKKWTNKEFEEQKMVTDVILEALNVGNCDIISSEGPETVTAGMVQHLKTPIKARMKNNSDWKKVLALLHPTPAVCGIPTKKAFDYIPKLENHNRHFYAGFIGIMKSKEKKFFVNLRCMEYRENEVMLYVGGGITARSNEEDEWQETENKSQTLLKVVS